MNEVNCKFVAIDSDTAPLIKQALTLCEMECDLINVGDSPVEDAIEFSDLAKDDGSGTKF